MAQELILLLESQSDTEKLAQALAEITSGGDTILLHGPVGAGKSALARAFIQTRLSEFGRLEDVPSPTFTLVQTYELPTVEIWHVDLYRLSTSDELYEIGLDGALDTDICLVEWPGKLGALRPTSALSVFLEPLEQERRNLRLEWQHGKWDSLSEILPRIGLQKDPAQ